MRMQRNSIQHLRLGGSNIFESKTLEKSRKQRQAIETNKLETKRQ